MVCGEVLGAMPSAGRFKPAETAAAGQGDARPKRLLQDRAMELAANAKEQLAYRLIPVQDEHRLAIQPRLAKGMAESPKSSPSSPQQQLEQADDFRRALNGTHSLAELEQRRTMIYAL